MSQAYVNQSIENNIGYITFFTPEHNAMPSPILKQLELAIKDAGKNNDASLILYEVKFGSGKTAIANPSSNKDLNYLLEALEQGDFGSFPSSCYATGFLKNYAALLGLDTKDIVSRYEAEYAGSNESVVLSFPEAENYRVLPVKSIAGIATLCVAIFVGAWVSYDNFSVAEETEDTFVPTNLHSEVKVIASKLSFI